MAELSGVDRRQLLAWAQALAIFTIAYNLSEGAIAITAALVARSEALLGFGFDSAVESISASVFLWRLRAERRDPDRAERVEHQATHLIGISFFILAAVVAFEAVRSLIGRELPDASPAGIALTAVSLVVMPILAWKKRQVATGLQSRAGLADSAQTFACVYLSGVVLIGLLLNSLLGWWWADPVSALGVVVLLLNEGREALFDDDDDNDDDNKNDS